MYLANNIKKNLKLEEAAFESWETNCHAKHESCKLARDEFKKNRTGSGHTTKKPQIWTKEATRQGARINFV